MVTIKKDSSVLTVTKGAYLNYYKGLGYHKLRVSKNDADPEVEVTHPEGESDHLEDSSQLKIDPEEDSSEFPDEDEVDLSEIPLGEMTGTQLRQYAEQLGLNSEGMRKRELRELIRNHLK